MRKINVKEIWNFNQEREWVNIIFNCDLFCKDWKINVRYHAVIRYENIKDKYYLII